MEMALSVIGSKSGFIFFNVSAAVGPNCPNQLDDVMLVQYFLRKLGQAAIPANNPQLVSKMVSIMPTGNIEQQTIECILAFQKHFGGIADGKINSARGVSYGSGTYTIWKL